MLHLPTGDLKTQLEQNRLWYSTEGAEGSTAYLAFEKHHSVDLTRAVLVGATLQETDFTGSSLEESSLIDALANGLIAHGCSINRINASGAELVEADFTGVQGEGAMFRKARLTNAKFDRAVLVESNFRGAVCLSVSFRQADLRRVDFSGALLGGADLTQARLAQARLEGAHLTSQTRLKDVDSLDLTEAPFIFIDGQRVEGRAVGDALRKLSS